MKSKDTLSGLFDKARAQGPEVSVDEIRSLIDSGKTSPFAAKSAFHPRRINRLFNPLKILVMITPIAIITSLFIVFNPGKSEKPVVQVSVKQATVQDTVKSMGIPVKRNTEASGMPEVRTVVNEPENEIVPVDGPGVSSQAPLETIIDTNFTWEIRELKKEAIYRQNNKVSSGNNDLSTALKTIKLSPAIFKCMGFQIASDTVEYLFLSHEMWLSNLIWGKGTAMKRYLTMDSIVANQERCLLYFIARYSVSRGTYPIANAFGNHDNYGEELEFCVPVQLDDANMPEMVRNAIFWIYPNEKFFSCLPPEIAEPMKKEFNYQVKKQIIELNIVEVRNDGKGDVSSNLKSDPVPCTYFTNLCEELPGLDYVNLYPNPASSELNVDLTLQKAKKIRFRVFDLGGRMLTDLGKPTNYPDGGQFTQKVDVSGLPGGIYLLVMTDDEGAKLTRRFVKN